VSCEVDFSSAVCDQVSFFMRTCTWAPTTFQGTQVVARDAAQVEIPKGRALVKLTTQVVERFENLEVSDLLIAQRWWGNGKEIEASSLDCLAMTSLFAGYTESINLITAIHPGFLNPSSVAKWGATIDNLTQGRWSINVTSGWNMQEFDMYGVDKLDHDSRYERSAEFIEVIRGAWDHVPFSYKGKYYQIDAVQLEPRPVSGLEVFQGGQSDAAVKLGASHSDWMFLNGGSKERISDVVTRVNQASKETGRKVRFGMYAAPLCRKTDGEAWEEIDSMLSKVDRSLAEERVKRTSGAQGMWSGSDPLSVLDTNEGYASRLIGSPETILERILEYHALGVEMLHLDLRDDLFNEVVLPELRSI
jgi:FMNH2-dependent dimethyl sulfone monooxygenase